MHGRKIMNKKNSLQETEKGTVLHLQIKPNSRKRELVFDKTTNSITIFVKSPPEKGKANRELLKFLAKYFEKPTNEMQIVAGQTSRDKTILFLNTNTTDIKNKLEK